MTFGNCKAVITLTNGTAGDQERTRQNIAVRPERRTGRVFSYHKKLKTPQSERLLNLAEALRRLIELFLPRWFLCYEHQTFCPLLYT